MNRYEFQLDWHDDYVVKLIFAESQDQAHVLLNLWIAAQHYHIAPAVSLICAVHVAE